MKNILLKIALIGSLMMGIVACQSVQTEKSYTAEVNENGVFVDGKPFRILSGEIHYFRVQPAQWRDRLEKLREAYTLIDRHLCYRRIAEVGDFKNWYRGENKLDLPRLLREIKVAEQDLI